MIFQQTPLEGAFLIDLETHGDDRGFFARAFCRREFTAQGLIGDFVQVNMSASARRGTLRGMHYQLPPHAETKLLRCLRGEVWDVILDLRRDSTTFGRSYGVALSDSNRRAIYVPKGFAHGFMSLTDQVEVLYFVDEYYAPEHERGIRWNDAAFGIEWPIELEVISDKDRGHPDFDPAIHLRSADGSALVR